MFKQSRRKIIASIMGAIVLFMAVVMGAVYVISYLQTRKQNDAMLQQYVERYQVNEPGGVVPDGPPAIPDDDRGEGGGFRPWDDRNERNDRTFYASIFYAAAFSEDGETVSVNNGNNALKRDEVVSLAKEIIAGGKTSGKTGDLLYRVEKKDGYTVVAFINTAITSDNMNILLKQMLIVGAAAIALIFFVARFLAYRIVRPLEENDQRQKQFVSDAGHELKTPVAVISANAELLSRTVGENEWLSNIRYETDRMGTLVTQLLDLSHAENAQVVMELVNFSRLAEGEALPFESMAFEAGLEIVTDIEEGVEVEGNRSQLGQLVSILLDNAIRHSKGGKEIALSLKKVHKNAVLTVQNSGDPIAPEIREKLFERFYRVDEARNSEGKHYGLGLAIAKAITEAHRGSIEADSGDGKVWFTASIPLK